MSCFGVAPSVREQGCLYTLSCVLPHTDRWIRRNKPIPPPTGTSVLNTGTRLVICKDGPS